jgi:hypothetical protein
MKTNVKALLLALFTVVIPSLAHAWDEDTCSDGSEPASQSTFADPVCANPQPLLGNGPVISNASATSTLYFDHSVSHWEFTYAMARCVGIADTEAQKIAAGDEATDMSSPSCGSAELKSFLDTQKQANSSQYFLAGYACGYEIGPNGDAGASAVPAYPGTLRWAHTDRCRSVTGPTTTKYAGLHGHGEYFHYPYWTTDGKTNNLTALEAWASGSSTVLIDPADSTRAAPNGCDMATLDASASCSSVDLRSLSLLSDPSTRVCASTTNTDWTMPAVAKAGEADTNAPYRLGIYLHSLGDSYSHFTCQTYAGQSYSGSTVVVATSSTATDHTDYSTPTFCGTSATSSSSRPTGVSYDMCVQACQLDAHNLEYGGADTLNYGVSTTIQALRNRSVEGFRAVWDKLAVYAKRSARDNTSSQASAYRANIPMYYDSYYNASDRQKYMHGLFYPQSWVPEQPCMCANGVYGWVPSAYSSTTGKYGPGYCSTLASIQVTAAADGTSPTSTVSVAKGATVQLYAWGTFTKRDGSTERRAISLESDWVVANTSLATVNNKQGATIGLVTAGSTTGTTSTTVTKLGISTSVSLRVQ